MFRWFSSPIELSASELTKRLKRGEVLDRVRVPEPLNLANSPWLTYLPRELEGSSIIVSRCVNLRGLPERLKCDELYLRRTNIRSLSRGLNVSQRIDAEDCRFLEHVSPLQVTHLSLRGCTSLERLPDGLSATLLDLSGCVRLAELPGSIAKCVENLDASFCTSLTSLPEGMLRLRVLNVRGCSSLSELPEGMRVRSAIELADSGLQSLPWSLRSVRMLWKGVPVFDRAAFDPDSITVDEILSEPNAAMRSVLLDRMGIERFLDEAQAEIVDRDCDAGGDRRLLRIVFPHGENVVCVEVRCPSTGSRYVLRVPPDITTCAEAAAWLAGYSDSTGYRPLVET